MSFQKFAQELVVMDPSFTGSMSPSLIPLEAPHSHAEPMHQHDHSEIEVESLPHSPSALSIQNPQHVDVHMDIVIDMEDLPGAGNDVPEIVVEEESEGEEKEDENDARKEKKQDKWDWESKGANGFVAWIKERVDGVPRHSGMDTAGLERAMSYLQRLDSEISKAMRLDLDGDLDANKIEEVRSKIDDGLSRLEDRLDKIKKTKKKKKSTAEIYPLGFIKEAGFVKEAQKITGVQGIYVTVPLLISRIARVCVNGMVSAGHDIEETYDKQVKLYKLSIREQAEVRQLLEDMGYAFRQDRGYTPEDALEVSSSDGIDWASNYKG